MQLLSDLKAHVSMANTCPTYVFTSDTLHIQVIGLISWGAPSSRRLAAILEAVHALTRSPLGQLLLRQPNKKLQTPKNML